MKKQTPQHQFFGQFLSGTEGSNIFNEIQVRRTARLDLLQKPALSCSGWVLGVHLLSTHEASPPLISPGVLLHRWLLGVQMIHNNPYREAASDHDTPTFTPHWVLLIVKYLSGLIMLRVRSWGRSGSSDPTFCLQTRSAEQTGFVSVWRYQSSQFQCISNDSKLFQHLSSLEMTGVPILLCVSFLNLS